MDLWAPDRRLGAGKCAQCARNDMVAAKTVGRAAVWSRRRTVRRDKHGQGLRRNVGEEQVTQSQRGFTRPCPKHKCYRRNSFISHCWAVSQCYKLAHMHIDIHQRSASMHVRQSSLARSQPVIQHIVSHSPEIIRSLFMHVLLAGGWVCHSNQQAPCGAKRREALRTTPRY